MNENIPVCDSCPSDEVGICEPPRRRADAVTFDSHTGPACLDKLDKIAEALGDKVVFAALCLDDPDFAQELVDEHDWDHITHGGMDLETKEKAKAAFGFNSVPHLVIIGADGTTLFCGSALKATADGINEALAGKENAPQPVAAAAPAFTMDDDF